MGDKLIFGNSIVEKIHIVDQQNVIEKEIKLFMSDNAINSQIIDIYTYEDDREYTYCLIYDSNKSIDDNFNDLERLNTLASNQDINYVFLVN